MMMSYINNTKEVTWSWVEATVHTGNFPIVKAVLRHVVLTSYALKITIHSPE